VIRIHCDGTESINITENCNFHTDADNILFYRLAIITLNMPRRWKWIVMHCNGPLITVRLNRCLPCRCHRYSRPLLQRGPPRSTPVHPALRIHVIQWTPTNCVTVSCGRLPEDFPCSFDGQCKPSVIKLSKLSSIRNAVVRLPEFCPDVRTYGRTVSESGPEWQPVMITSEHEGASNLS